METPERVKRPIPPRTGPRRNVLGALGQTDGRAQNGAAKAPEEGGHPLGPGFGDGLAGMAKDLGVDPTGVIDEGVRAASDLVDQHIKQGEATAKALAKGTSIPLSQTDISGLLTGLVRAYSDVASVWVDIVGSLAQKVEGLGQGAAGAPAAAAAAGVSPNFGLSLISAGRVETRIEMFKPAAAVIPQPLVSTSVTPPAQITEVSFVAEAPARLSVEVSEGQAPGVYYGLLLSAEDQSPAGVLVLTVHGTGASVGPA